MAIVKVCDRCGNPILGAFPNSTVEVQTESFEMAGTFSLCRGCSEMLNKWIRPREFSDIQEFPVPTAALFSAIRSNVSS